MGYRQLIETRIVRRTHVVTAMPRAMRAAQLTADLAKVTATATLTNVVYDETTNEWSLTFVEEKTT